MEVSFFTKRSLLEILYNIDRKKGKICNFNYQKALCY